MRKPSEEDVRAFREAVQDVRPIRTPARVVHRRKPAPKAKFRRQDDLLVLEESLNISPSELEAEVGDTLAYRKPGVQDSVMRKLRRGNYRVEDEIDLHGLTLKEARQELRLFLSQAITRRLRCVRIVHGKGLRSGDRGPVLKQAVNVILQRTDHIVAFCSARAVDGGTGALYALLHS